MWSGDVKLHAHMQQQRWPLSCTKLAMSLHASERAGKHSLGLIIGQVGQARVHASLPCATSLRPASLKMWLASSSASLADEMAPWILKRFPLLYVVYMEHSLAD